MLLAWRARRSSDLEEELPVEAVGLSAIFIAANAAHFPRAASRCHFISTNREGSSGSRFQPGHPRHRSLVPCETRIARRNWAGGDQCRAANGAPSKDEEGLSSGEETPVALADPPVPPGSSHLSALLLLRTLLRTLTCLRMVGLPAVPSWQNAQNRIGALSKTDFLIIA